MVPLQSGQLQTANEFDGIMKSSNNFQKPIWLNDGHASDKSGLRSFNPLKTQFDSDKKKGLVRAKRASNFVNALKNERQEIQWEVQQCQSITCHQRLKICL